MDVDLAKLFQNENTPAPINLKKYFNYVLKKKVWILVIAIVFSILAGTLIPIYLERTKKFTTSAVIRFDDPRLSRGISAVTDFSAGMETLSKASLFTSNSFMESVVDSLDLNLVILTPKVRRTSLFSKINIGPDAVYGKYTIKIQTPTYIFEFEDPITKDRSIIKTLTDSIGTGLVFNKNGLDLFINTNELSKFDEVEFVVTSIQLASNFLKESLYYDLDRTRTIMTISFEHSDPEFSPYVTNNAADMFIKRLLEYKRFQTLSILNTLDEQMKVAQVELSQSEQELRQFREENPNVFLSQGRETLIGEMANHRVEIDNIQNLQLSIDQMQQKLVTGDLPEAKQFVFLEIISFLENQNVPGASLLSNRYQTLLNGKSQLINENYSEDHPLVQNIVAQIEQTQTEISGRLNEYKKKLSTNLNAARRNMSNEQRTLRSLPRNELRLAELQRNREIKENILASIMVRYNEAKVTDAAVIPDAYIVDRAVPPIILPSSIWENMLYIVAGFLFGIILGILVMIAFAFIDKKIWTVQEVQDKIKLPILAQVPDIGTDEKYEHFKNNETIDPKLIISDYAPTLAGETIRRLRTVLGMQLDNENKAIIVGSLFPSEGKSLISANLAIAFAQQKKKTLLIDGDLRRGVQHSTFAKNKIPGLTDLLIKKDKININMASDFIQDTHIPNLFLMTSGNSVPNPSELLGGPQMEELLQLLNDNFECIIFDSPPFGLNTDLMVLAKFSKNVVLVLRSGKTNLSHFKNNLNEFRKVKENVIGLVVNGSNEVVKGRKYQYSYYQY
ncbi:MAG: polysaccharide biosynthesis tyrosine autokinase [Calditrichaceae bacterium]